MKKEKRKLTPAELSAIRAEAGRKGGSAQKNGRPKCARVQIQAYRHDHDVLAAYGQKIGMTIVGALHHLCRVILQNHPDIGRPKDWID